MANSKYEYVRTYEDASDPVLVKNSFIAIRIDGQRFHQFSKAHSFNKPNDKRALDLMVEAATNVIKSFHPFIKMAYGQSDEFSFIMSRKADCYKRRTNKIISLIVSTFTSAYVFNWSKFFTNESGQGIQLKYPPAFDGRCAIYPSEKDVIDYIRWRQVDCHINNLYNTTFYALTGDYINYSIAPDGNIVTQKLKTNKSPMTPQEAQVRLKGTVSSDKHDIMFLDYGINYNNEIEQFKKGSLLILESSDENDPKRKLWKKFPEENKVEIKIKCLNVDVIKDTFWEEHRYLLE